MSSPDGAAVAAVLDEAASRVEATPGMNVLDALRDAHQEKGSDDDLIGAAYYALLDYLPPHVEFLGPWSDSETAERVAGKLRQCAKTSRNGGPAHVDAAPPPLKTDPSDDDRLRVNRNEGAEHHASRQYAPPKTALAALQHERGIVLASITRAKRAKHPDAHKLTENELRLARVEADIAALQLVEESQAFPPDHVPARKPGTESGL